MTEQAEAKIIDVKDGKLLIEKSFTVDPNKDGQPLAGISVKLWVDIAEIPDEAVDLWMKKKGK